MRTHTSGCSYFGEEHGFITMRKIKPYKLVLCGLNGRVGVGHCPPPLAPSSGASVVQAAAAAGLGRCGDRARARARCDCRGRCRRRSRRPRALPTRGERFLAGFSRKTVKLTLRKKGPLCATLGT